MKNLLLFSVLLFFCCSPGRAQDRKLDRKKLPKTVYFADGFDDNRNAWHFFDHAEARSYMQDGKYYMQCKDTASSHFMFQSYNIDPSANRYIEMAFSTFGGPEGYGSGLLFNRASTKKANKWSFVISPYGKFRIYKTINGKDTTEKAWTVCDDIVKGDNNRLAIFYKGSNLYFYINDRLVYDIRQPEYLGSDLGFMAARLTTIAVDSFVIRYDPAPVNAVEDAEQGYKKVPLGGQINTELDEGSPILSADGKMMCFNRMKNGGSWTFEQSMAFHSEYDESKKAWTEAKPFSRNINSHNGVHILYLSPDKNTIIINSTYDSLGKSMKGVKGLSVSHRNPSGWSDPENIFIEGLVNKDRYSSFGMAANNRVLLISVEMDGSYGERDLYVSFLQNGKWSPPRNMGPVINSFADESSPCMAPDNVTLYYSSIGKPGYGKSDVFVSRRLDDSWLNWTEPKNLGPEINSKFSDGGMQVDANGQYAYMNLVNEGNGRINICKIELPPSARPKPVVILTGHVYNAQTKKPMSAEVIYENIRNGNPEGITNSGANDGSFVIVLPYGLEYGFTARAKGYIGESQHLNLINDTIKKGYQEMSVDLYLTPLIAGQFVKLNNIFFVTADYELMETSYTELDRLVEVMEQNSALQINVEGHTDMGSGGEGSKILQTLSENRANAVKDYLIKKGVDGQRIFAIGFGNSKPISKNQSLNRRVEIKIRSMD